MGRRARTNSRDNAHKKLVWCTERRERVIDSWVALSPRWSSALEGSFEKDGVSLPPGGTTSQPTVAYWRKLLAPLVRQAKGVPDFNWSGSYTKLGPRLYPHQWSWDSAFVAIGYACYQ